MMESTARPLRVSLGSAAWRVNTTLYLDQEEVVVVIRRESLCCFFWGGGGDGDFACVC